MKNSQRITAAFVSAALAGSMVLASGQAASATTHVRSTAPTSAAVSTPAVSSVGVTAPLAAPGSLVSVPAPKPGTVDAASSTALAVPWVIRLAVKAALATVKRTSVSTYNTIIGYVLRGKTAFVNWWNTSVPTWVKNLFGGISASAIYDAIRWIIGI